MDVSLAILFIGVLIFLAHVFSGIFHRTQIPDVLPLIGIGIVIGPLLGVVGTDDFGAVGPIFTTVALVLILFEGGLELRLDLLRASMRGTTLIALLGFAVTVVAVAAFGYYAIGLDVLTALILGSILGAISPAVVLPLSRKLGLIDETRAILFLESAVTDVLCIVLTLGLVDAALVGDFAVGGLVGDIVAKVVFAILLGGLGAVIWSIFLSRIRTIENTNFITLASVFVVFGLVEWMHFSGPIAALVFGFTLGNVEQLGLPVLAKYLPRKPIGLNRFETMLLSEVVFWLKTFFFVYIGLSILFTNQTWLLYALAISAIIFVVRLPIVRLGAGSATPKFDASIMAVMVPKGLASAVMAAVVLQAELPFADLILSVTNSVILITIVLTAGLAFLISRTPIGQVYKLMFTGFGRQSAAEAAGAESDSDTEPASR